MAAKIKVFILEGNQQPGIVENFTSFLMSHARHFLLVKDHKTADIILNLMLIEPTTDLQSEAKVAALHCERAYKLNSKRRKLLNKTRLKIASANGKQSTGNKED